MKTIAIATLLLTAAGSNAFADEPYPHDYLNEGHFAGQTVAPATPQDEKPYRHEYLNGGHFDAEFENTARSPQIASQAGGRVQAR